MNDSLQTHARNKLKEGLSKCSEGQQLLFKKMYSFNNLDLSINEVVDLMNESKLDWAMQQVQRTLEKGGNVK